MVANESGVERAKLSSCSEGVVFVTPIWWRVVVYYSSPGAAGSSHDTGPVGAVQGIACHCGVGHPSECLGSIILTVLT